MHVKTGAYVSLKRINLDTKSFTCSEVLTELTDYINLYIILRTSPSAMDKIIESIFVGCIFINYTLHHMDGKSFVASSEKDSIEIIIDGENKIFTF